MSDDLRDFFSEISKSKKEKKKKLDEAKEELNSIVGDLGLDSLFQEFGKIKKEEVVKKKKQEKKLEAFENFFSTIDEKKKEEPIVEIEEVIEEPKEVIEEVIEEQEEVIEEQEEIIEEPVVAEEEIEDEEFEEEVEEVLEDVSLIEKSLGMLAATDNNEDPLTPVDKKFATMEDFQKHYGLLIQRIQQQLSTIGGGGAVNIRDLDDIDLSTAQVNNKFLKYNSASGKWVGSDTAGGGYELPTAASDTLGGIKIGSGLSIDTDGVVTASGGGGGSIAGIDTSNTSTFNNVDITGITTIGNVVVGGATTDLIVDGDARVTGILTIGTASITLDPNAKTITGLDEIEIGTGDDRIKLKKSSKGTIDFVDKDNKSIGGIGTEAVFNTTGIMTATRFRTIGGTAAQFLKADGTVDTNTYLNSTHDASNVTNAKIANWDLAYGWGNHATAGYAANSHSHGGSSGISDVVEDTTPQLGGNLDLNSKDITGTGSINITGIATAQTLSLITSGGWQSTGIVTTTAQINSIANDTHSEIALGRNDATISVGNEIGRISFWGNDTNFTNDDYYEGARISVIADSTWKSTNKRGSELRFYTAPSSNDGAVDEHLRITESGDIFFFGNNYNLYWDKSLDDLRFTDNAWAVWGSGGDMRAYHDGSNSYFGDFGTGDLKIRGETNIKFENAGGSSTYANFANGGAVDLYHSGSKKFETDQAGVKITGVCSATSFSGPLTGDVTGDCSGEAGQATTLATARNFSLTGEITASDTSFNGSADCDIATTIADDVVDAANLKVSNNSSASNGQALVKRSGNTGGMTWETISGGGGISNIGIQSAGTLVGTATTINFTAGNITVANDIANVSVGSSFAYVGARVYFSTGTPDGTGAYYYVSSGEISTINLDTHSFYNSSNGRYEIPAGVTKVRLRANIWCDSGSGSVANAWQAYKNGSAIVLGDGGFLFEVESGSGFTNIGSSGVSGVISVSEGDYIQIGYQVNSTGRSFAGTWQLEVVEGSLLGHYFASTNVTNADNITVQANNSTNETVYPIFVDGATGAQGPESDTGFTYNPSSGNLTATTFTGAVTGNVTGDCSGEAATATALASARTIGGVSFDGSANIDLPGVNSAGNQNTSGTAAGLSGTPSISVADVTLTSTDGGSSEDPTLKLYRNSSSPANNDLLGTIKFEGRNNNTQDVTYAQFLTRANVITDGAESGNLFFRVMSEGSLNDRLALKGQNPTVFSGQNVEISNGINLVLKGSGSNKTILAQSASGEKTVTFPDVTGTVALTSSNISGTAAGLSGTPNISVNDTSIGGDCAITGELTAGGLTYPTANGTDGQVLTSDGAGVVQWEDAPGAGGGISGITVQEEGSSLSTLATTINFVGDSVTASGTGATKTITISGGGGGSTDMLEVMLFT